VGTGSDLSGLLSGSLVTSENDFTVVILGREEDGLALVKYASGHGLKLKPFYGNEPDVCKKDGVYVSAGVDLCGDIAVVNEDMYVEVPAYSVFAEIKGAVTRKAPALWLPFLAEDEGITAGDLLTEYPPNPLAPIYGELPRMVLGVEGLLGTGDFIRSGHRTVKGVAGYDLTGLFIGSAGLPGLITRIRFRLWARPPARTVWATDEDIGGHRDGKLRKMRIVPFCFNGRPAIYAEGRPERLTALKNELGKATGRYWDDVTSGDDALEVLRRHFDKTEFSANKETVADEFLAAFAGPFDGLVPNNEESG
jgi:hypothetical protein